MGVVLTHKLVKKVQKDSTALYLKEGDEIIIASQQNQTDFVVSKYQHYRFRAEKPSNIDYREVFPIRNFYSAFVSAYEFHKLGSECLPSNHYTQPHSHWATIPDELGLPAVGNRTMCDYLAQESRENGVLVIMKFFYHHYRKLYATFLFSRQPEALNKTMIVCFEDLVADETAFEQVLDHLFPSGHPLYHAPSSISPAGDHGTSSVGRKEKQKVLDIVKELDKIWYKGQIGQMANEIGCGV